MTSRGPYGIFAAGLLSLAIIVAGCEFDRVEDDGAELGAGGEDDVTATVPASPPQSGEVASAANSTREFGFDLFHGLAGLEPEDNVITSPYSAAVLLTMLLNGADGETRQAIGDVLHLEDPFGEDINQHHQALAEYLMSADPDVELAVANSLWANEGTAFEDDYMTMMEEAFDARIEAIDLGSDEAVDAIDGWVSEQTRDRIEEMAEDLGLPDPNSVLILLNAVYFLGDWTEPFDPDDTSDGSFTLPDGSEVEVPLMNQEANFAYAVDDDFQVLRLTYGEEERLGMDIFLPDEGSDLSDLREELNADRWSQAISDLNEQPVNVTLPSFELEYNTEDAMDEVLQELGMGIAYDGASDFTPMSPADPWLDTVVQKTFIRVDEEGTEAAAVTGGAMVESLPPQFVVDRPFLFTISDAETGTVLFLGQVTDPS